MIDWHRRFEQFAARKEAEAVAADIAPFATELECAGADLVAIGNDWSRTHFDGPWYLSRPASDNVPATSLVFVQSREGNTGANNPSALGGGSADTHLIYEGLSRVAADGVMAGAETIRGGNMVLSTWHPELVALRLSLGLPRHPAQIVATLRGLTFDSLLFNVPELRVILVTVGACSALMLTEIAARPWITTVQMPTAQDLPHAFRQLRRVGIDRISCIGGRTIAGQLIDAGLVQDMYLTTSAKSGGEPGTPFYSKPLRRGPIVRKRGTGADGGVIFEHLVIG
jgi:5-amino-6-(5-phosphoribosylamino)uracil reductase